MKQLINQVIVLIILFLIALPSHAFESDVHFGLTKWLALKAGFTEQQADTIATGNQRIDSGVMDSIQLVLEYACLEKHFDASQIAQSYHFASASKSLAEPVQRTIVAGSKAAFGPVDSVLADAGRGKAEILLLRLGQALHLLQDSWAYQGVPSIPEFDEPSIQCDPMLAWSAPTARGGWNSHRADFTKQWPTDVTAMAQATYRILAQYPVLSGVKRNPEDWKTLQSLLMGLIQAESKADKQSWFNAQGIQETSFLEGISIPDGKRWLDTQWNGRRLPTLKAVGSTQFGIDNTLRHFYDSFFAEWLGSSKKNKLIGKWIDVGQQPDLHARLKLWRMKDHGAIAAMVHSQATLTRHQIQALNGLEKLRGNGIRYDNLTDAFFPLLQQGPGVSPLLPYVIHALPPSKQGNARAIAVAKLRHTPYDEVGLIAQQGKEGWKVVKIISVVNH